MRTFDDHSIMEKEVSRERVFDGIIIRIDHVMNELPNGKQSMREIAMHTGACAVIPVDKDGNTYLVRQFRSPMKEILMEIPVGKLDYIGEDRFLAAQRELREETGFTAKSWQFLTDIYSTPGFSDEKIALYLARDLDLGATDLDEDEFLNVVKMPFDEAYGMAMRGELRDAKTIIALSLAKQYL